MKSLIKKLWITLRTSYWFFPTVMSLGAVLTAIAAIWIDKKVSLELLRDADFLYTSTPVAARTLLATLAGSMITVAGVTFAITISSVGYATAQYGPRVLTNFLRDRGNQFSQGAFIANFLYCLFVLRSVQSPDQQHESVAVFIPQIAIIIALLNTIACAAVLIFYIHHVPFSLHISNLLAAIGTELERKIEQLFPDEIESSEPSEPENRNAFSQIKAESKCAVMHAHRSGFLQAIDEEGVIQCAKNMDATVELLHRPGDFLYGGQVLANVWLKSDKPDDLNSKLNPVFALGFQRTPDQDARFLVNELVEIAARAWSPSQNDPFTAIAAMDWLAAALIKRLRRTSPSRYSYDSEGILRSITSPITDTEMIDAVYDQLRPYVATDVNASIAYIETLRRIANEFEDSGLLQILSEKSELIYQAACKNSWHEFDLARLAATKLDLPKDTSVTS